MAMPEGDIRRYRTISLLIIVSLAASGGGLLLLNTLVGDEFLRGYLKPTKVFGLQLFLWGALGASIASSLFLARDKEENELESCKAKPDPAVLRYPTNIDVHLYLHRILTSACLAVVGALVLYSGLGYFDLPAKLAKPKHRAFFMVFAFMVGLYQGNFLLLLKNRFDGLLKKPGSAEATTDQVTQEVSESE